MKTREGPSFVLFSFLFFLFILFYFVSGQTNLDEFCLVKANYGVMHKAVPPDVT